MISRNGSERETAESYPYANASYYPYGTGAKLKVSRELIYAERAMKDLGSDPAGATRGQILCA